MYKHRKEMQIIRIHSGYENGIWYWEKGHVDYEKGEKTNHEIIVLANLERIRTLGEGKKINE